GVFGSCTQLITIVGMIIIYGLGMGVRTQANSEDPLATPTTFSNWRVLSFICIIPSGLLFVIMLFARETPRWLATRGRLDEAKATLQVIRGVPITDSRIAEEVEALEEAARKTGERTASLAERMRVLWSCKRQTIIAIAVPFLNQFTGLSAIVFYQTTIFIRSGLQNPNLMSFTVQLTSLAGNILALIFIDRLGRRPLGMASSFGMGL
ncbi:transporter, partial [Perkinsus olseni]